MSERATIHGLPRILHKLEDGLGVPQAAARLLDTWRFATERQAKANIKRGKHGWLSSGHTRRSLTSDRDRSLFPIWARVGSNLATARWGEFGTGLLSEDPTSTRKRHWPPASALEPWARKHGSTGFLVARAIGLRGGIEPRRFLRNAAEQTDRDFPRLLATMARDVVSAARAAD